MQLKVISFFLGSILFLASLYVLNPSNADNYTNINDKIDPSWSFKQLSEFFEETTKEKGAEYTYALLAKSPLPPNTDLHLMGHVIGDVLYKQQGSEGIRICTQDFRNACSHSIVVGLLLEKGENSLLEISNICRNAPGGTGAYTMCFHGLGHGILAYTGYDLKKAVDLCEQTGTKEYNHRESTECIGGSIMEIIGGGFHNPELWRKKSVQYLIKEDPLSPCNKNIIPENSKNMCYMYLTPHLFVAAGGTLDNPQAKDFEIAFTFCNRISSSDTGNKNSCFAGFGKEFVVLAPKRDIRKINDLTDQELTKIHSWCNLANETRAILACVNSATASLYWGGENEKNTPIKFCSLANLETKEFCFNELINAVGYYIKDLEYRKDFCQSLPLPHSSGCTKVLLQK